MLNNLYLKDYNFLFITLDSLKYCTTLNSNTPNISKFAKEYKAEGLGKTPFRKVYTQATYTLPSHFSMFYGILPDNRASFENYYNRKVFKPFYLDTDIDATPARKTGLIFNNAPNIIKGFQANGYKTFGIGGVGWFNNTSAASIWRTAFFQHFYWRSEYSEASLVSLDRQLKCLQEIMFENSNSKTFTFINISVTHFPYQQKTQEYALEKFDSYFNAFIEPYKNTGKPLFLIMVSDHGDVMGEDWKKYGQRHAFYLPERGNDIMEIPMLIIDIQNW